MKRADGAIGLGLWVVIALAATVGGLLTSFVVSCYLFDNGRTELRSEASWKSDAGIWWTLRVWERGGRDVCNVQVNRAAMQPAMGPIPLAEYEDERLLALPHREWRDRLLDSESHPAAATAFFNMRATGWPMKCFAGGFINVGTGGVDWGRAKVPWFGTVNVAPIWGGLIVDSVMYGAAWAVLAWGMLVAARAFARRRRTTRGLCLLCGYDLQRRPERGCPECGWNRPEVNQPESAQPESA